jgi:hypothetical protein
MAAKLVTIYWRDIPAQVNAQAGRTRHAAPLHRRFQRAIDKAAMVAGLTDAHEYVKEWRRDDRPCSDDLEAEATTEAARLDALYPRERLQAVAASGGFDRGGHPGGPWDPAAASDGHVAADDDDDDDDDDDPDDDVPGYDLAGDASDVANSKDSM